MEFHQIAGFISVALFLPAIIPYIRDILRGNTKPQRMAHLIFSINGTVSFIAQALEGATYSLLFTGGLLLISLTLLVLSLKKGVGGHSRLDFFSLIFVIFIIALWVITESSSLAIVLVEIVNITGMMLIFKKTYELPHSEYMPTWIISCVASVFGVISVGKLDYLLMLPAGRNMVTTALVILIILWRKRLVAKP